MKKELLKLADKLDECGHYKMADKVSNIIEKIANDDYTQCFKCGTWYSRFFHNHERKSCPKCGHSCVSELSVD